MDAARLRSFIEKTYCVKYNPLHVYPLIQKNTKNKKYFLYRPFKTGFLQQEFWFDVLLDKFVQEEETTSNLCEPMTYECYA